MGLIDTAPLAPWNHFTDSSSRFNLASALVSLRLVQQVLTEGVESVGIITPFAGQARLLRRILRDEGCNGITAATVHPFQGDERDVLIFDAVADQPGANLGRLLEGDQDSDALRLINVARTRVRAKFLFVGNRAYLKAALKSSHGLRPFFWEAHLAGGSSA